MNVQKFKADEVKRLFRHCLRTKDKDGKYYDRTNPDIDFEKTHLNYSFEGLDVKQVESKLKNYMKENVVRNKTTVVACSWVIQLPDGYTGNPDDFFKAYNKIMSNKYHNVIDCFVHFDETTPHAHFIFCPILDGKFNAKAILTKQELTDMHLWMEGELEKELGYHVDLIKDETRQRKEMLKELAADKDLFDYDEKPEYLSMRELKRRTQLKIMKEYEAKQEEFEQYKRMVENYKKDNLDAIIEKNTDYVPKAEVQDMLRELIDMLEMDLGAEKTKKYRKFLEGFGYVFDKIRHGVSSVIERIRR